jgi:hypothetical protein
MCAHSAKPTRGKPAREISGRHRTLRPAIDGAVLIRTLACFVTIALTTTAAIAGIDIKVNQDVGPLLQNVASITINRGWSGNIVVGYNENPGSGVGLGISYSFSLGTSWNDSQTAPVWGVEAYPALASDILGNVFAAMISYAAAGPMVFPSNGIYVSRSTDGGVTWGVPTTVDQQLAGAVPAYFTDKEYIAVDQGTGSPYVNNVYIAWQRDNANGVNADIFFARSNDQAATFNYATGTPTGRISDLPSTPSYPPTQSSNANGPVPAVAPNGDVYVAWQDAPQGMQTPGLILVDKSTDGGQTFGSDVVAATYNTCARWPNAGQSFKVRSFPSIAVSPVTNLSGFHDVYVVYAEDPDRGSDINIESDTPGANLSFSPEIACSGAYVYAVWTDTRNSVSNGDIYFNRSIDNGATWGTDVRLNTGSTPGAAFVQTPRIASDGTGVYAVWEDRRNGNPDIYYNFSSDNGATWLPAAVRLDTGNTPGSTSAWAPQVAASGGFVYAVWTDDRSGDADVLCNYSADGGVTWQASAVRVDTAPAGVWSNMPQMTCQGANVCVTWWDARNGIDDIFANASANNGATWLASDRRLDTASGYNSGHPRIASTGTNVYVAWEDSRNGQPDVYFNYSADSGVTWQTPDIRLDTGDTPGASTSGQIDLACLGNNVYAVWSDDRNGNTDIYYNASTNNGALWGAPDVRIDADFVPGAHNSYSPRVSAQSGGVYVAWEDDRHGFSDIYFRYSLDNGVTWYRSASPCDFRLTSGIHAGISYARSPRIVSAGTYVYAVWDDSRNGLSDIYFNSSANNGVTWRDGPDDGDIMLVRSANGGSTWGVPVRVNDDATTNGQFQPWIDVKPNGTIDVVWYDRRNDPNNSWLDVYMGTSTDRGQTFVNSLVTDVNFGPPPPPTVWPWPWMGEYIGIDVDSLYAYIVWTDTRLSDRDIYFDRFLNPGATTGVLDPAPAPEDSYLEQNMPNPFNPTTTISYRLDVGGAVSLRVYDVSGKLVRVLVDGLRPAGYHEAHWDSRDESGHTVASGVYIYQLEAPGYLESRKMVLLK